MTIVKKLAIPLEEIIANLPGHVYWKDQNGMYFGCNDLQAKMAGFEKAADLIGKSDFELPWKEQAPSIHQNDMNVMECGHSKIIAEQGRHADGRLITSLSQKTPLRDKQGNVIGVLGISFDITDIQHEIGEAKARAHFAEQRAKEMNTYLNNILSNSPSAIYWKDKIGKYLGCNETGAKITGLTPEEVIGKTDKELSWNESADILMEHDQEVMRTGKAMHFEELIVTASGKKRTYLSTKVPLRDSHNNIIGVLGSSINITDRKTHEKALYQAKEAAEKHSETTQLFLENIIENLPGHVYWTNEKGEYLGCNRQQAQSLGLHTPKDFVGKTAFDIGKKLDWNERLSYQIHQHDQEVMRTGKTRVIEEQAIWENQRLPRTFLSSKAPIRNKRGDIIGLVGTSIDITERKLMENKLRKAKEQAEKANRIKSDFLAMMSHELRTPLHGILGMAQLLQRESLTDEQKSYVDDIYRAGNILLSHVNDVLDYSKLEVGKLQLEIAPFNLLRTIKNVHKSLSPLAKKKNINLTYIYPQNCPKVFISDSRRLSQVLFNLIGNAIKFTDKGSVKVITEMLHCSPKEVQLKISIIDSGKGIPRSKCKFIFKEFTQLHSSYLGQNTGTGLGLAISKKIISLMHGEIGVNSKLDVGSTFWFKLKLPVHEHYFFESDETNAADSKTVLHAIDQLSSQFKVLLVEDDPISQRVAKSMLLELGYMVEVVASVDQAFVLLKNQYDFVLTDIGLPDKSGYELITNIRHNSAFANNKDVYIVAVTAHAMEQDRKKCLIAGANAVLTKPLNYQELQAILLDISQPA